MNSKNIDLYHICASLSSQPLITDRQFIMMVERANRIRSSSFQPVLHPDPDELSFIYARVSFNFIHLNPFCLWIKREVVPCGKRQTQKKSNISLGIHISFPLKLAKKIMDISHGQRKNIKPNTSLKWHTKAVFSFIAQIRAL